ncbi:MAG: glycosyltransferase [Lentimicrobiaceae bacterium]|jgi:glycosyltransferase involved in cell wall biosynthesis|nr:glycosyltransferase [Lentimicrobiaceae bacterium]
MIIDVGYIVSIPATSVSIIVPIFNCENYLLDCLNSIKNQSYQDFELILINDASTDNTQDIIDDFLQKNKELNIRTYKNDSNKGDCFSRNLGIEKSLGEFICFCDADDFYHPLFLESMLSEIIKFKDLVYCGYDILNTISRKTILYENRWQYINNSKKIISYYLQSRIHFAHVGAVYRKSFLIEKNIKYNENTSHGSDLEFVCNILLSSARCGCVQKSLYYYRIRTGSITTSLDAKKVMEPIYCFRRIIKKINNPILKYKFITGHYSSCIYHLITEVYTYQIPVKHSVSTKIKFSFLSYIHIIKKKYLFSKDTYKYLFHYITL